MKFQRGFTLVEIMIAVLISAILSVMAFEAMQQALGNRERVRAAEQRVRDVQNAMRSFVQDFSQITPRPVREPLGGEFQAAVLARTTVATEVTLTRGGWMNPAGLSRSTLQRVRYALREGKLYREYWTVLDAALEPQPQSRVLLSGVKGFRLRFMNDGHNWQEGWPPPSLSNPPDESWMRWRPIAVEVTLELEDWGKLTRLIEVPG
jgi:general secretion pathway protein J